MISAALIRQAYLHDFTSLLPHRHGQLYIQGFVASAKREGNFIPPVAHTSNP